MWVLCRSTAHVFLNMPDQWCKWYGHYLNDEFRRKLLETSFWSQVTVCREQWMIKMRKLQLPVEESIKGILAWCKEADNKLIDSSGRRTIPRWTAADNKIWREEMDFAINKNNFQKSDRNEMLKLAQMSEIVWVQLRLFMRKIAE
jgi:hypothetical protein